MSTVIVLIFFHILVLQEYWVLAESRIPLKPVLGHENCCTFREFSIKPSLLFLYKYCRFCIFLKDLFLTDYLDDISYL